MLVHEVNYYLTLPRLLFLPFLGARLKGPSLQALIVHDYPIHLEVDNGGAKKRPKQLVNRAVPPSVTEAQVGVFRT